MTIKKQGGRLCPAYAWPGQEGGRHPSDLADGKWAVIGPLLWRFSVMHRLSDNDFGVTRKDSTKAGKYRPGYAEVLRLVTTL